jgi:NAD(P)-dependent dehydrogenase (short-subunit alcohol dehydrogenase family)
MNYVDQVVIVTGAARGIGAGCARVFIEAGARVVVSDRREDEGNSAVAALNALGRGEAHFIRADMSVPEEVEQLIRATVSRFGRIDCLVNNAGWHPPHKPIDDFSIRDFQELINLNLLGMFAACKFALPHLRATRGNIINIASLVASIGQRHATTYVATKGAALSFTKALAIDEAPHGVRVNSISPGNIWTPLWQEAVDAAPDPLLARAEGEAAQPLGRMGVPEEVGKLALFLASEAAFITGADHVVSGGAELGYGRKIIDDAEYLRLSNLR